MRNKNLVEIKWIHDVELARRDSDNWACFSVRYGNEEEKKEGWLQKELEHTVFLMHLLYPTIVLTVFDPIMVELIPKCRPGQ